MAALTNFAELSLLNWMFRGAAMAFAGSTAGAGSGPANFYAGLLTVAASDSSAGTEVVGGSYARAAIPSVNGSWNVNGITGIVSNAQVVAFPAPTANWGTCVGFGLYDSPTGGNLIAYSLLTESKVVNSGDAAPDFSIGALSFQLDD